jgi:hypothetical protein
MDEMIAEIGVLSLSLSLSLFLISAASLKRQL